MRIVRKLRSAAAEADQAANSVRSSTSDGRSEANQDLSSGVDSVIREVICDNLLSVTTVGLQSTGAPFDTSRDPVSAAFTSGSALRTAGCLDAVRVQVTGFSVTDVLHVLSDEKTSARLLVDME